MLRNLRTVRPIFPKIVPKVAQDFKEKKSRKLAVRKKFSRNYCVKRRGGPRPPPPPPVLLGLNPIYQAPPLAMSFLCLLAFTSHPPPPHTHTHKPK